MCFGFCGFHKNQLYKSCFIMISVIHIQHNNLNTEEEVDGETILMLASAPSESIKRCGITKLNLQKFT